MASPQIPVAVDVDADLRRKAGFQYPVIPPGRVTVPGEEIPGRDIDYLQRALFAVRVSDDLRAGPRPMLPAAIHATPVAAAEFDGHEVPAAGPVAAFTQARLPVARQEAHEQPVGPVLLALEEIVAPTRFPIWAPHAQAQAAVV